MTRVFDHTGFILHKSEQEMQDGVKGRKEEEGDASRDRRFLARVTIFELSRFHQQHLTSILQLFTGIQITLILRTTPKLRYNPNLSLTQSCQLDDSQKITHGCSHQQ
jgi:hypothetical protein